MKEQPQTTLTSLQEHHNHWYQLMVNIPNVNIPRVD